jgi:hypothetical protein
LNTVRVALDYGQLYSAAEIDVLDGANAGVLGDEIIQWRTAAQVSAGVYELSGLLRGRRGTEDAVAGHAAGDRFVVLTAASLGRATAAQSMVNATLSYRGPTVGGSWDAATTVTAVFRARSLRCLAPVHIAGTRDDDGNVTVSWVRRARWYGEWVDGVDVPLFESAESYEADILDGSGAVRRTLSASSPSVLYSVAAQVADFGSVQSFIRVAVAQLNAVVGRGISGKGTV